MQSLFPQHNAQSASEKPLLEFKAGKCVMVSQEDGDFMVSPDDKRGKIAIVKGEGYVYFRWIDRSSNQMDVNCNWIVFQNSVVFKKIDTGRAEDRVYLLKWKDEARRLLFWLQDKSGDQDEEHCKQVNELFNNPAAVTAAVAAASQDSSAAGGAGTGADEWMRMLGLTPPAASTTTATTTAPPASTTSGPNSTQALDLARILAGLGANSNNIAPVPTATTTTATTTTAAASTTAPAPTPEANTTTTATTTAPSSTSAVNTTAPSPTPTPTPIPPLLSAADLTRAFASTTSRGNNSMFNRNPTDLNQVLTADAILATGVLNDPTVRANLLQLLPEGQQTDRHLEINLRSPQFQQALDALGSALSSDNFNSVMANLGIDPAPGSNWLMRGDFVAAFLTAANAAAAARREAMSQQGDEKKDDVADSKMDES